MGVTRRTTLPVGCEATGTAVKKTITWAATSASVGGLIGSLEIPRRPQNYVWEHRNTLSSTYRVPWHPR